MMDKLVPQLKRHEGRVLDSNGLHKAYRDHFGNWTIGYGHNLDTNPVPGLTKDSRLTEKEAHGLLVADITKTTFDLKCSQDLKISLAHASLFESLSPVRQAVLINMAFNLGIKGLCSFKKFLACAALGAFTQAAGEMLDSCWSRQVGERSLELAAMMARDEWLS